MFFGRVDILAKKSVHVDIGKWVLVSCCIGVFAGLGITVLYEAVRWSTYLFLGLGAGFFPPVPLGEGRPVVGEIARRWMIPVLTTLGGLLTGWIIFRFAPETAEHGADDVVIDAFHHKNGFIRARVTLVKVITAAITIGSGGSAGREGPSAMLASGISSVLGRVMRLDPRDRRIAVAAGIGAGIGAILKVPLGGALLSTEILYLDGFEIDVLVPSFIATVVSYTIFASFTGYQPIFDLKDTHIALVPLNFFYFLLLGLLCGLVGIMYPKVFYLIRTQFRRLRVPNWVKPALGGLLVGIIGLFLPQVLGMGYGWLQIEMLNNSLPLIILIAMIFAKTLATSLSLGSGGSGGVMAPGLFIGGMVGAALWQLLHITVGHVPSPPQAFIVVGMLALFGAVANAPVSVMIMVVEMTGNYELLVPAMLALGLADALVGRNTIYESQLPTPADSPVHRLDYHFPLLKKTVIKDVMNAPAPKVTPETALVRIEEMLDREETDGLAVVSTQDSDRVIGVVTREDIVHLATKEKEHMKASNVMNRRPIVIKEEETLDEALARMVEHNICFLPVVVGNMLAGTITRQHILRTFILGEGPPVKGLASLCTCPAGEYPIISGRNTGNRSLFAVLKSGLLELLNID